MTGAWKLTASDASELAKKLGQRINGAGKGPPRPERRGKQKELERHNLNRFLIGRGDVFPVGFPLHAREGENPDFVICENGREYGLEVTEAVDPVGQARWTRKAKVARAAVTKPVVTRVGNEETSHERYIGMVAAALRRKAEKCTPDCNQLLVYLNTNDDDYLDADIQLAALCTISLEKTPFERIWVLANGSLFELVNKTLVFAKPEDG